MQNRPSRASELNALLTHLKSKKSPRETQRMRAAAVTAEIIARIQRESRLRK